MGLGKKLEKTTEATIEALGKVEGLGVRVGNEGREQKMSAIIVGGGIYRDWYKDSSAWRLRENSVGVLMASLLASIFCMYTDQGSQPWSGL